ncbi:MAG: SDR family oxidoreductase [Acidobacteria bacterium]|nr:SDR family oxidoreductase [Acidobacteriota bacterium]
MNRNKSTTEKTLVHSRRVALVGGFSLWAGLAVALALSASTGKAQSAATESAAPASVGPAKRQVILVTGATSGLGHEAALRLAATGAHIIVHGRNRERGMEVVKEFVKEVKGSAMFYAADFASLKEVREFAETILRDYDRLDVLINNAGIWLMPEDGRQVSADGHELHFAVNYLSGFLLTRMLLPRLIQSAPSHIVNVSSGAHVRATIDFDDVMLERNYSDSRAYPQSKLAQVLFTFDLARELQGSGVIVSALHPGSFMDTNMIFSRGAQPRSSVKDGAEAVVHLVTAPDLESGQYFNVLKPERPNALAYDEEAREKLRKLSIKLTGISSY